MKICVFLIWALICFTGNKARGQAEENLVRLPITAYIVAASDSVTVVQIQVPAGSAFTIKEKTLGILNRVFQTEKVLDTAMLGFGRCNLIKGEFYYFGLRMSEGKTAQAGDLLSMKIEMPVAYKGLLFDASCNHILFTDVYEKPFYDWQLPFRMKSATDEEAYFSSMQSDIKLVGAEMAKQMPENNMEVKSGLFAKQKIFQAMQNATVSDLKEFFKYMKARPKNYAGNTWKISEIFATWASLGAPQAK